MRSTSSRIICSALIYLKQSYSADIRLDLHKTLDTITCNTKLPKRNGHVVSACCVSYVGSLTATRINAREDSKEKDWRESDQIWSFSI